MDRAGAGVPIVPTDEDVIPGIELGPELDAFAGRRQSRARVITSARREKLAFFYLRDVIFRAHPGRKFHQHRLVNLRAVVLEKDMTQPGWNVIRRFEGRVCRDDMK